MNKKVANELLKIAKFLIAKYNLIELMQSPKNSKEKREIISLLKENGFHAGMSAGKSTHILIGEYEDVSKAKEILRSKGYEVK